MNINAREVALMGLGYSVKAVALFGFIPINPIDGNVVGIVNSYSSSSSNVLINNTVLTSTNYNRFNFSNSIIDNIVGNVSINGYVLKEAPIDNSVFNVVNIDGFRATNVLIKPEDYLIKS